MIIDGEVFFKMYEHKILNFYGNWNYVTPCCSAKNSFIRHATYKRYICTLEFNEFTENKITILRLLCKSCKKTHAILPAGTIPYWYFSFECVFKILLEVLIGERSVPKVADKYKISVQILYLFLLKYNKCKNSCINFLNVYLKVSIEYATPAHEPMIIIGNNFTQLAFYEEYFKHTKNIFLMTRCQNILPKPFVIGMNFLRNSSPT